MAKDAKSLAKSVEQARTRLRDKPAARWSLRGGAFYGSAPEAGKLAFLFPGEGSQYTNMLADLALCFDEVRQWLDFWHSLYDQARGDNRTDIAFPHASENDEESRKRLDARLHDMDVGSEAVFVAGMAMQSLLRSLGVEPDVMMGHSSGESAALAASGAVPAATPLELAAFVRELNAVYERVLAEGKIPTGALLAVGALPAEAVQAQIAATGSPVVVAMDNCANQLVLYGTPGRDRDAAGRARRRRRDLHAAAVRSRLSHRRLRRRQRRLPRLLRPHQAARAAGAALLLRIDPAVSRARPRACASSPRRSGRRPCASARRSSRWSPTASAASSRSALRATSPHSSTTFRPARRRPRSPATCAAATASSSCSTVLAQLYASGSPGAPRVAVRRPAHRRRRPRPSRSTARPYGVLLDNTMPMLRYSESDREALRKWVGVACATPLPSGPLRRLRHVADAAATAAATRRAAAPARRRSKSQPGRASSRDPRADVMAEYFDVMRGFLEQQRAVVESWQARSVDAAGPDAGRERSTCRS